MLGLAFVASIGALAFFYYAEFRDAAGDTLTAIDARLRPAPGSDGLSSVETARPAGIGAEVGERAPQSLNSAVAAGREPDAEAAAGAASEAVPARQPSASEPPPAIGTPLAGSILAALPVRSDGVAMPSAEPQFGFDRPVVTVSEGMSAVSIVIRRTGDASLPASVVWWLSDQTAKADEDYADLGQRTERFAAGEDSRAIFIPLIGDSVPEPTESFFVYVGRGEASRSHVEVLSSAQIDVDDDD